MGECRQGGIQGTGVRARNPLEEHPSDVRVPQQVLSDGVELSAGGIGVGPRLPSLWWRVPITG